MINHSALYECTVMHHRLAPKVHHFSYRIFLFALDLDEIDEVAAQVRGFSRNRRNLYEFRDRDHLDETPGTVKEKLRAYLLSNDVTLPPGGRVLFVTLPRVFGYIFNPVSFYFCFDAEGSPFCAVVQVGNTFREMKLYLLAQPAEQNTFRMIVPKHFYVSPFFALDTQFDFKLRLPTDKLDIHIDDIEGEKKVLLTALTGTRVPLTSSCLAWLTLKYPFITLKVIYLIHWNALLLWLKRVPWFAKAANRDQQREVLRPHSSLTERKA